MNSFLHVVGNRFQHDNRDILLRGVGLGNWLNLEHFLIGLPGTDSQIRESITQVYGKEKSAQFWEKFYAVSVAEKDIAYCKACGFNSVRIPVNYKLFYDAAFETSTAIVQIDRILAVFKKYDIWGIIDLHAASGGQNPDWHSDNASGRDGFWSNESYKQDTINLWKRIASYYANNTSIGGYDLINEPCYFNPEGTVSLMDFYKRVTIAIREVDRNHIIFYEGNTYTRNFLMFTENLDENCSYTFHLYPFLQIPDKLQSTDIRSDLLHSLHNDVSYTHLTKTLQKPLWCGETGHTLHLHHSMHVLTEFLSILEQEHVGWSLWPLKDAGAMAMLYTPADGAWQQLCKKLSNNWVFWDSFSQDSILSAKKEQDPYVFYTWLADKSTAAHAVFADNLTSLAFETLYAALDDFAFDNCTHHRNLEQGIEPFTKQPTSPPQFYPFHPLFAPHKHPQAR